MRNHIEKALRIGCIALGALLLFQVVRTALHSNLLAKVSIPNVPTLGGDTNTSTTASAKNTNAPAVKAGTNAAVAAVAKVGATNVPPATNKVALTNMVATTDSNKPPVIPSVKEVDEKSATNVVAAVGPVQTTITNESVQPDRGVTGTNNIVIQKPGTTGTNTSAVSQVATNGTNAAVRVASKKSSGPMPNMASMGMPGMVGGKALAELPPAIRARVDRIYESELFGMVMRPMPAGLMGIAGNSAFLRSSSGQTGLVKEGDSLGEMKLIRIGINRVLVEEKGEKKELMVFNGYGGESLMAKQNETLNETTSK
jgi:hypothetical protein